MKDVGLKILFLEDALEDVELVERAIQKGGIHFEFYHATNKESFIKAIRAHAFDVILSDHSLPQFDSTQAFKLIRRAGIVIPFILVTGTVSEEYAIKSLKSGIDDYVLKSGLGRLPESILGAIEKRRLESERLTAELIVRSKNIELKKINAELDNFVYSISHDLRAPLMSLLGLLNISKRDIHARDPIYGQYFQMMESSVKSLDNTLKEIMKYSLLRAQNNSITITSIDFVELLDNNLAKLRYLDGFNKMQISHHLIGVGINFHSSLYYLSQIFSSLLSNVIKYRDEGKAKSMAAITITISSSEVSIEIKDNGIGIEPDQLSTIFDMFYRGSEKSGGSGLGLYVVKQAVEKIKGIVTVDSQVKVGTTTLIKIPNLIDADGYGHEVAKQVNG